MSGGEKGAPTRNSPDVKWFLGGTPDDDATREGGTLASDSTAQGDGTLSDTQQTSGALAGSPLKPGEMLGGFEVIRQLAEGGMGRVFLAQRSGDPALYALKTLTLSSGSDGSQVERFKREIAVGQAISHPNVCRVLTSGAMGALHYLVMEYLDGQTLKECIEQNAPLSTDVTSFILRQILLGLEAIHAIGAVHRDLKPSNVMLLESGTVKIMDLGISRSAMGPTVTRTGAALGTPDFIAPEQLQDAKRVDHRADLFCVGLIGYQMLSGKLPYDAPRMSMRMMRLIKGDQTPLSDYRPDVAPPMLEWLGLLLRHAPEERFMSAYEARLVLESTGLL